MRSAWSGSLSSRHNEHILTAAVTTQNVNYEYVSLFIKKQRRAPCKSLKQTIITINLNDLTEDVKESKYFVCHQIL